MPDFTLEFIADVLGTSEEQVAKAIKDGEDFKSQEDVNTYFKSALEDRIYAAKREVKEQQYSRGKKEALTAKEREIREKYDLSGSTLEDMIDELKELAKQKPDLTPEDVRNTEIYKVDVKTLKDQISDAKTASEKVVKDYRAKEVSFKARQIGEALLKKHKFVTPDWAFDDSLMSDLLYSKLNNNASTVGLNEDGELMVVDASGNQLMDDKTVSAISFEKYFVDTASKIFKVAESDGRESPGNENKAAAPAAGSGGSFQAIKSDEDYLDRLNGMKDMGERRKFIEFYESSKVESA